MQGGLLLPVRRLAVDAHRPGPVPRRLLLRAGHLRPEALPVRPQVPGGVGGADRVPAALLLPAAAGHRPDPVPHRVPLRPPGPVQRDGVPAGYLRVVPGQAVVRRVRPGAVLPDAHRDAPVPRGLPLPARRVGAGGVPGRKLLPARVGGAGAVPGGDAVGGGGQVAVAVHGAEAAGWRGGGGGLTAQEAGA